MHVHTHARTQVVAALLPRTKPLPGVEPWGEAAVLAHAAEVLKAIKAAREAEAAAAAQKNPGAAGAAAGAGPGRLAVPIPEPVEPDAEKAAAAKREVGALL